MDWEGISTDDSVVSSGSEGLDPDLRNVKDIYDSVDQIVDNHDEVYLIDHNLYVDETEVNWREASEDYFERDKEDSGLKDLYVKCMGTVAGAAVAAAGLRYNEPGLALGGTAIGAASLAYLLDDIREE